MKTKKCLPIRILKLIGIIIIVIIILFILATVVLKGGNYWHHKRLYKDGVNETT